MARELSRERVEWVRDREGEEGGGDARRRKRSINGLKGSGSESESVRRRREEQ